MLLVSFLVASVVLVFAVRMHQRDGEDPIHGGPARLPRPWVRRLQDLYLVLALGQCGLVFELHLGQASVLTTLGLLPDWAGPGALSGPWVVAFYVALSLAGSTAVYLYLALPERPSRLIQVVIGPVLAAVVGTFVDGSPYGSILARDAAVRTSALMAATIVMWIVLMRRGAATGRSRLSMVAGLLFLPLPVLILARIEVLAFAQMAEASGSNGHAWIKFASELAAVAHGGWVLGTAAAARALAPPVSR